MKASIIAAMLLAAILGGCNDRSGSAAMPPPVALNADAMGVFCGMNLAEHPGPKGQIITASRIDPYWFSSARDALAFTHMPDQPRDIKAIYVSDMGRAQSWDQPGETNWIDAKQAYYVIESRKQGGMGAAEAVPFGERTAADTFAAANGGRVVRFDQVPQSYLLGSDTSTADD
ncbi:MAG: copper resistance protein CopZ [Rhodopseudomonas palustris]|nr:MAG: copper resistance protein CopZ [Rhodopseudomonas palustris]